MQEIVDYSHDVCTTIAVMNMSCQVNHHCSLQGSRPDIIADKFPLLVGCIESGSPKKAGQ